MSICKNIKYLVLSLHCLAGCRVFERFFFFFLQDKLKLVQGPQSKTE